jgi:hypothetical protein
MAAVSGCDECMLVCKALSAALARACGLLTYSAPARLALGSSVQLMTTAASQTGSGSASWPLCVWRSARARSQHAFSNWFCTTGYCGVCTVSTCVVRCTLGMYRLGVFVCIHRVLCASMQRHVCAGTCAFPRAERVSWCMLRLTLHCQSGGVVRH